MAVTLNNEKILSHLFQEEKTIRMFKFRKCCVKCLRQKPKYFNDMALFVQHEHTNNICSMFSA